MHFYFKKALLFWSQFCESEIWEDSTDQSLLGVSTIAAVTCQLGSRYGGAVLGWMSTMAHSHGWRSMQTVSGSHTGAVDPRANMQPLQHNSLPRSPCRRACGMEDGVAAIFENGMCQSHLLKAAKLRGMSLGPLTVKTFNLQNSSLGSISENRWALLGKLNRQVYF